MVTRYPDSCLYAYGSYEAAFLRRMGKGGAPDARPSILSRVVNVLSLIYAHVYFPTYSNSLKDIGRYRGCRWTAVEASGLQNIVWRWQWETTGTGGVQGPAHDLQHGGLSCLTEGHRVLLYHMP